MERREVNTKPFDQKLYNENDSEARYVVMGLLRKHGIACNNNTDLYGVDILVGENQFGVEVERRPNWKNPVFPFNTVHIPGRKLKFLENGKTHYAIVSYDFSLVGIAMSPQITEVINNKKMVEVPNKFVSEGEEFIDVPRKYFHFFNAQTGERILKNLN